MEYVAESSCLSCDAVRQSWRKQLEERIIADNCRDTLPQSGFGMEEIPLRISIKVKLLLLSLLLLTASCSKEKYVIHTYGQRYTVSYSRIKKAFDDFEKVDWVSYKVLDEEPIAGELSILTEDGKTIMRLFPYGGAVMKDLKWYITDPYDPYFDYCRELIIRYKGMIVPRLDRFAAEEEGSLYCIVGISSWEIGTELEHDMDKYLYENYFFNTYFAFGQMKLAAVLESFAKSCSYSGSIDEYFTEQLGKKITLDNINTEFIIEGIKFKLVNNCVEDTIIGSYLIKPDQYSE